MRDNTADTPEAAPTKRRAGRKRKFEPDQVQSRMVDRAVQELLAAGISFGVDAIRIDRVLVLAEVPRGSAYEAWEHPDRTPQESLRHATVLHILKSTTANNAGPTRDKTLELLADLGDDINSGDLDRKRRARGDVIRAVAVFNHDRLNSEMWRLYTALVTAVTTNPNPDPEILEAIEEGHNRLVESYVAVLTEFAEVFGMSLKPGFTIEHFVLAIVALNDGLSNHSTTAFSAPNQEVVIDDATWSLYGISCQALADGFFTME